MGDIAPELLESIREDFKKRIAGDARLKVLENKIEKQSADYTVVNEYADRIGKHMSDALRGNLSSGELPDGVMYYNIAERIIPDTLLRGHGLITGAASQVIESMNRQAGLGIKAITPAPDMDRIEGFVNAVSGKKYEAAAAALGEPVERYARSVADDATRANADFQSKAGLFPKIKREAGANCCDWCADLEGEYEYGKEPEDVYRRHAHCKCAVIFQPQRGKYQDVWSKKTYTSYDEATEAHREMETKAAQLKDESKQIIGLKTKDRTGKEIQIRSVSGHTVERMASRNVSMGSVRDALLNPLTVGRTVIDERGRPSIKIIGRSASVAVNPDTGNITTVWATGTKTANKYGRN